MASRIISNIVKASLLNVLFAKVPFGNIRPSEVKEDWGVCHTRSMRSPNRTPPIPTIRVDADAPYSVQNPRQYEMTKLPIRTVWDL